MHIRQFWDAALWIVIAIAVAVMLMGCVAPGSLQGMTTFGVNAQEMSAEQIKEAVSLLRAGKEKDSNVVCYRIPTPWGVATVVEGNANTAGRMRGKLTMSAECNMTVEHDSQPPPAVIPPKP